NKATHFGGGRSDYEINTEVFPLWRDTNLSLAQAALSNSVGVYQQYFGAESLGDASSLPAQAQINSIIRGQRSSLSHIGLNGVRTLGDLDRQYQDYGYDLAYRGGQNSFGQNYQNSHLNNYQQQNLSTNRGGVRAPIYQAPYQQPNYRPPY